MSGGYHQCKADNRQSLVRIPPPITNNNAAAPRALVIATNGTHLQGSQDQDNRARGCGKRASAATPSGREVRKALRARIGCSFLVISEEMNSGKEGRGRRFYYDL